MGKFVIECPDCGSYVEVGTGLFAKKEVTCACGKVINAKANALKSKVCPHCGNTVMYDQSKGDKATCPVCHKKINTIEDNFALIELKCPICASTQKVNKKADKHTCSLCGESFDVKKMIAQAELKASGNASIIKWDGSEDLFVYKHPIENFNLGSQLIVRPGQEVLFFRDGRCFDLFGPGRYTLEKNVIPKLNEIYKLPEDSDIAIQTEVVFINKVVLTGIKWGTPGKVRIMEPTLNFPVEIGARGSYNLEVVDSRTFIARLIGAGSSYVSANADGSVGYGIEYIRNKFADMIAQNISSMLAKVLTENKLNLLTIDTKKPEIARLLGMSINGNLAEYGLQIPNNQFYLTDIVTPEDDPNYIRMKKQYESSLDLKDNELKKAKILSDADVTIAERQAEAKIDIFEVQTEMEKARLTAQGFSDSSKIIAQGSADSHIIGVKAEAEGIRIMGSAEADAAKLKSDVLVGSLKSAGMAEAEILKAKGGDYKLETDRIVNSTIAENGVTFVNINVEGSNTWNCSCGKTGITSNFCPNCGAKKDATPTTWDCKCGMKGIAFNFCPNCGTKKGDGPATWDCKCGMKGITFNFCPNCGNKKS